MALTGVSTSVVDMSGDTTGLVIAKGTTAERNAIPSPQAGMIRDNTETDKVEVYNGTDWRNLVEAGNAIPPLTVDYLVVAGGGGGGGNRGVTSQSGGGGGAGGLRTSYGSVTGGGGNAESTPTLDLSTNYTITVGAGGSGGTTNGTNGNNSVFNTITSTGGGFGASHDPSGNAGSGGSGGGRGSGGGGVTPGKGLAITTPIQGYNGGNTDIQPTYDPAGGGGAGGLGEDGGSTGNGGGGSGINSLISGISVGYAGGGAGGWRSSNTNWQNTSGASFGGGVGGSSFGIAGGNGGANTGGGGGGGSQATGGTGGSGVVILKYPDAYTTSLSTGGGLTSAVDSTSVPGYKVESFTSGTGTITFS